MSFEEFAALVGPPTEPPIPVDWDAVESWLGLRLPTDYKAVASGYGPVDIGGVTDGPVVLRRDGIGLRSPVTDQDNLWWDYTSWLTTTHRDSRRSVRGDVATKVPPFHPDRGGLLAWGTVPFGTLFWDTAVSPNPDEWTTVLLHRGFLYDGDSPWHRYNLSTTGFVVAAIRAGIDPGEHWGFGSVSAVLRRLDDEGRAQPWVAPVMPDPKVLAVREAALRSGSGLETLTALVPPPVEPMVGRASWDDVATDLGTPLPDDYRALSDCYGEGIWRGSLAFFSRDSLAPFVREVTDIYRELRSEFPEFYPLAAWPEPGGFLPFADQDGDMLAWLTEGDPGDWPLVVVPHDDDETCYRIDTGLVETLLAWCRGVDVPGLYTSDPLDDFLQLAVFRRWADCASRASNA